jgi:hypothetical protein
VRPALLALAWLACSVPPPHQDAADLAVADAQPGDAAQPANDLTARMCATGRVLVDQPDDQPGYQVHAMYVLPSDGADAQLDTNGAIARSLSSFETWLAGESGNLRLRLDTCGGNPDITFYRMARSDLDVASSGAFVRDQIEAELTAKKMIDSKKLYAVYYGGSSTYACGGGPWPPSLVGHVAAEYLLGQVSGAPPCSSNPVGASATKPGYFDFAMLHELMHALGIVASCAPHFTMAGHVSDSPMDLMYAGSQPWQPAILDLNHDDYFQHNIAGCVDLAKSVFIDPLPTGAVTPPGW